MLDFQSILFNIDMDPVAPQRGSLLISEPFMRDQYFGHSVIELIDYEPGKQTMGIVMNRLTSYTLAELVEGVDSETNIPIFCGGPMSGDRLYFMHDLGNVIPESHEIMDGLNIGGRFDSMLDYINAGYPVDGHVRFFVGYSGWDAGQLEEELAKKVWAVNQPKTSRDLLVGEEDAYWHRTVKTLGEKYKGWLYHPQNPRSN